MTDQTQLPLKEGDEILARWAATRLEDNARPETAGEYALHDDGRVWAILPNGTRYCWQLYDADEYGPGPLTPITYMRLIDVESPVLGASWRGYLCDGEWLELVTDK